MSTREEVLQSAPKVQDTRIDRWLLLATICILIAGGMTVYSASSPYGMRAGAPSSYFLSHLKKIVMGVFLFLVAVKLDYHRWQRLGPLLLAVFGGMMLFVNTAMNEAHRWIEIGSFRFQPSEAAKYAVVIFLAGQLSRITDFRKDWKRLLLALAPIGVVLVLLEQQPNYSMLMVVAAVTGLMLFLAGLPLTWFAAAGVTGVLGVIGLLSQGDFHSDRIDRWLESFGSMHSGTDQVMQSFIGFGRGGLTGVGAGNSMQKYFYLPEPFNDFIFSIWGEEFGLIGCVLLILAYALIFWRGFHIVRRAQDDFGRMLAAGITGILGLYTIINMMVSTGLLPVTGLPLPLFSYGGTAMITLLGALGILMNISYQSRRLDLRR
ncbi:MAG: cell division protein FtsW [Candidatus Cloacimonetes bacterium]|nr:cell division protein FtsW [Candidatus Cloacimonadota bacterium]